MLHLLAVEKSNQDFAFMPQLKNTHTAADHI